MSESNDKQRHSLVPLWLGAAALVGIYTYSLIGRLTQPRIASGEWHPVAGCVVILAGQATFHKNSL